MWGREVKSVDFFRMCLNCNDYKFERVWKNPDTVIENLSRYRAVLSPDFSMYLEMAPVIQLYNVFRNRWCGAYWASKGVRVVPTVN